ncbi:FIT family protein scs3 [Lachnellula suecica]|uniref:Acyl-coenzyme A diphosphatase SCS3 n=1 Tax=Lachnellula suecica TaxID=602035 RepID=A0A8T9C653_9HELO|nr:FIT family protein scs3 [Lachnellula suecica]
MDSNSATPRRSQRIQKMSSPSASTPSTPNGSSSEKVKVARRSPYLPTTLETILLAIYPSILVIGSLFALLDPAARAAPYNATTQSHNSATAPSYFAKKSNVFNLFFVKQGWAWVTFSYLFFIFTHPSTGTPFNMDLTPRRWRGMVRYGLVTGWWMLVTQWCFGPAIIDRGFRLTGGQCELVDLAEKGHVEMDDTRQFVTGVACKAVGGKWSGGHDISGHVFILVLGSMFLFEEVLHVVLGASWTKERTVYMADGAVKSADVEARDTPATTSGQWNLAAKAVVGIGALSMYMLFMTAAYFHTWFEKFTGLLVASSGIFVVYFLPRFVPALRNIIGMPGV